MASFPSLPASDTMSLFFFELSIFWTLQNLTSSLLDSSLSWTFFSRQQWDRMAAQQQQQQPGYSTTTLPACTEQTVQLSKPYGLAVRFSSPWAVVSPS
jgi:hypothetical protein